VGEYYKTLNANAIVLWGSIPGRSVSRVEGSDRWSLISLTRLAVRKQSARDFFSNTRHPTPTFIRAIAPARYPRLAPCA
jgi:hypothetical protein